MERGVYYLTNYFYSHIGVLVKLDQIETVIVLCCFTTEQKINVTWESNIHWVHTGLLGSHGLNTGTSVGLVFSFGVRLGFISLVSYH